MAILRVIQPDGTWVEIPALVGRKGDRGERGERGEQGIQGERGERGEQGIQGERGERGEQGEQGIQGERGERGLQGYKGDSYVLTENDKAEIANSVKTDLTDETWVFTIKKPDGSTETITKVVCVG